ncbi:MAG: cupin domain-containing protein [Rhodospirillales bacterium]|nr:cupin domain-containing protein [Rhodospirillales bacterium]
MNRNEFEQYLASNAYAPAQAVTYPPHMSNDMHTHEFTACLLIVEGTLTLTTESGAITYQTGESCEVAAGTLHSEQTGADGVTFLASRK